MIDDKYRPCVKESYFGDVDVLTLPVRHGKWLCSDDMYETAVCSVCNCDTEEPYEYVKKSWNVCKNCGAKMDAERKEQ